MASVKREQILQEAEKLAARGKLDAAVREYRRALDHGATDTTSLNRLGDLLVRINRIEEAIDVYQRIAEHFANDGFFLKGIAIYKKINRLDPQRTEIYERLADLYFKQGLVVEGRQQLLTLSDWFQRSKRPDEAARVYRRLVELEPANLQARAKLVDLLIAQGADEEVGRQIEALTRALLGRGMLDEAIKLCSRALEVGPGAAEAIAPCIEALVQAGRADDAVSLAEAAREKGASSATLREATARATAETGDLERARTILEELIPEVGENTRIIQLYGDVLLGSGEVSLAKDRVLPTIDRLVGAGDRQRAAGLIKKLLRGSPGDMEILERALKVFDRRRDADMVDTLEAALADAYFRADRRDDARKLYRALQQRDPSNRLFVNRLADLGVPVEPQVTRPPSPGAAPEPAPEPAPADSLASGPAGESVSDEVEIEFVDVDLPVDEPVAPSPSEPREEDTVEHHADGQTGAVPHAEEIAEPGPAAAGVSSEEFYTEAAVFAKYGLVDKALSHLHRLLAVEPDHAEARQLLEELGGGAPEAEDESRAETSVSPTAERGEAPSPTPMGGDAAPLEFDLGQPSPLPARSQSGVGKVRLEDLEAILGFEHGAGRRAPVREPSSGEAALSFDLEAAIGGLRRDAEPAEAVSFDIAGESAAEDEEVGPAEAASVAVAPAGEVAPAETSDATVAEPAEEAPTTTAEEPVELVEVAGILTGPSEEQLRELDFFIEQGLREDAARQLERLRESFPDHAEVLSRQALLKTRGWDEAEAATGGEATASELFSEEEQFFDLAAELERELAEDEMVAEARGTADAEVQEASIEELFREFQRGVAEQLSEEDFDTHFNLGLAYREMGLLDEAIGEFQLAAKAAELFVECASMIGACLMDKGLPEEAIGWYGQALGAPDIPPEAEVGLRYELARAEEVAGNTSSAVSHYAEVLAMNPGFRDVVARLERLRSN